jgi:hypothetical protein
LNRYTPCRGKLNQHATRFPHSVHVWPSTIRISWGPRIATFHDVTNRVGWMHCSRLHISTRLVVRGTYLSFSPNIVIEAVHLSQAHVDDRLLGLLDPYHQHAISIFNTCSRGATDQSLTDTGGGYNLGGVGLPHHTPRPSQLTVLHFPPKGPARSQVINYQHKPLAILRVKHLIAKWSPCHSIYTELTTMPSSIVTAYNY